MAGRLDGRVAVVTGASSGIGEATVRALATEGAAVVAGARRRERLGEVVEEVSQNGGKAIGAECEVTDEEQAHDLVRRAVEEFGRIDILVNNAGVMLLSRIERGLSDQWRQMFEVNVMGLLYATHAAIGHMKEQGSGHLINMSSVAGRKVRVTGGVYSGTKFAVNAISEALRLELVEDNIRVTVVEAGVVDTELATHITDVVNLIKFENLHDVVLLGHSYAGIVVTGVADRIRDRISQLVYLDSGPTPDGLSFLDTQPPEVKQYIERQVAELGDGWRLPVPSWEELENVIGASLEGLDEPQRRRMRAHAVAQPFGTYTQPLRLGNTTLSGWLTKVFITNSFPLAQVKELIASEHPWFREFAGPEWRFLELPTGHWPMFSRPHDLAALLNDIPPSEAPDIE